MKSNQKYVKEKWNEVYRKESQPLLPHEDLTKIVRTFKMHGVRKILDLGCGSGRHTVYLASQGFEVWGIDISEEAIKKARSHLENMKLNAHLTVGSIYKPLPYENSFFDALICTRALHHAKIRDIRKAIKEIERVLKSRGLVFVTVRKKIVKDRRLPFRDVGPRIYVPLEGKEKGLIHYLFNRELLRKEFKSFKIHDLWVDSHDYYCLLGELKKQGYQSSSTVKPASSNL